jgi:hypothetical protein
MNLFLASENISFSVARRYSLYRSCEGECIPIQVSLCFFLAQ